MCTFTMETNLNKRLPLSIKITDLFTDIYLRHPHDESIDIVKQKYTNNLRNSKSRK